MTIARIYIVRHGETDENRKRIMQGQLDTFLNRNGKEQARLAGQTLQFVAFDRAFSSDLRRASETAETILKHHPAVKLQKQEELRERYMGKLQGKPMSSRQGLSAASLSDHCVETDEEFIARANAWWNTTILGYTASLKQSSAPRNVLVTSHGGFITKLIKTLIQNRRARCAKGVVVTECFNSSITVIDIGRNGKGVVVKYADVGHLLENNVESITMEEDPVVAITPADAVLAQLGLAGV